MKPLRFWHIAALSFTLGALYLIIFMWRTSDGRLAPAIETSSPAVIAHHGAGNLAPENTLAALRKSIQLRVDFIEIDVQRTYDGVLVLMHDPDVSRTTDGSGYVHKLSLADLKKLDAGSWFDRKYAGEPVPTLAEALELLAPTEVGVVIEVKKYVPMPGVEKQIVDLVEELGMEQRTKVLCSDPYLLQQVVALNSHIETIYGDAAPTQQVEQASKVRSTSGRSTETASAVKLTIRSIRLYMDVIDQLHQAGKQVFACAVSDEEDMRWLIGLGVDAILTDEPALLLQLIESG